MNCVGKLYPGEGGGEVGLRRSEMSSVCSQTSLVEVLLVTQLIHRDVGYIDNLNLNFMKNLV